MIKQKSAISNKIPNAVGSISAFFSTLGSSWSVCHSVCILVIAFLSTLGIVVAGFPFFFLFQYNLYLWGIAIVLFVVSLILFFYRPHCMSRELIIFNAGVLIAGTPQNLVNLQPFTWIIGGLIAIIALALFFSKKIKQRGIKNE